MSIRQCPSDNVHQTLYFKFQCCWADTVNFSVEWDQSLLVLEISFNTIFHTVSNMFSFLGNDAMLIKKSLRKCLIVGECHFIQFVSFMFWKREKHSEKLFEVISIFLKVFLVLLQKALRSELSCPTRLTLVKRWLFYGFARKVRTKLKNAPLQIRFYNGNFSF